METFNTECKRVLAGALAMANKGFRVFPCKPNSKEPACQHWQHDATNDPAVIAAWFDAMPEMNYAIPLDEKRFVLDLDTKNGLDGIRDLEMLSLNYGDLPETLTVETPSGGRHSYLAGSAANSVGKIADGIDVRGRGGYALGPGCHVIDEKNGIDGDYKIIADLPIASAPEWLLRMTKPRHEAATANPNVKLDLPGNVSRGRGRLLDHVRNGRVAKIGHRGHDTCYEIACELVRDLGISTDTALGLMLEHWYPHCEPNDDPGFVRERVLSAGRNGQNAPGSFGAAPPEVAFAGANLPVISGSALRGIATHNEAPPEGISAAQWDRMLEKYRPRDPVEEANRPPLTFYDKEHLWPLSPEGAVGFVYGDTGTHKTGLHPVWLTPA